MAVCRMSKVQIVAHKSLRAEIISYLQEKGSIHITDLTENTDESQDSRTDVSSTEQKRDLSDTLSRLQFAIDYLSELVEGKSKISSVGGKLVFSPGKYSEVTSPESLTKLQDIADKCYHLSNEITRLENQIARIRSDESNLRAWYKLEDPIESLSDTERVCIRVGSIPAAAYHDMLSEMKSTTPYHSVDLVNLTGSEAYFVVSFLKEEETRYGPILAKYGFSQASFPRSSGKVNEILSELNEKEEQTSLEIVKIESESRGLVHHIPGLMAVYDLVSERLQRLQVQDGFLETESAFILEGWVNSDELGELRSDLENRFREIDISEVDPSEGEEPPVAIKNRALFEPFQMVTNLYGMPQYREIDPTPFFAPFFAFFFGVCITDAGYGVVMIVISILALRLFTFGKGARQLTKVLLMSGVMTIVAGILTGGYFGVPLERMPAGDTLAKLRIVDPNDPAGQTKFLYISWGIGTIHVWIGFLIKFIIGLRDRDFKQAFRTDMPWVVIIPMIVLLIVGVLSGQSQIKLAAGVLLAVCGVWVIVFSDIESQSIAGRIGNGFFNLYGVSGVIGDILSYSRLFALGLATGIIGQVVNTIAVMVMGVPVIGYVVMVAILIGGHLFNLVINALGGFIHTARLQFVEYFTKFFEGGGEEFRPFAKENQYTIVMNLERLR